MECEIPKSIQCIFTKTLLKGFLMNIVLRKWFPKDIVCMIETEVNVLYQREWFKRLVNVNVEYCHLYATNEQQSLELRSNTAWRFNYRLLGIWPYTRLPIWNVKYLLQCNANLPEHYNDKVINQYLLEHYKIK